MKRNSLFKKILLFSLALLITGCGSGIVGPVQNYTENQAPVIESFTSDLTSGSDSITSGTAMTLTVTTSDPENETLKYEFSSDDGSFSSQTSIDNGTEVEFTVGNKVVASQSITVKVTVSDGHKNSVSKTLTVGKTKDSAVVSITSDSTSYVKSTGTKTFTFTASETGTYQVQVQPSGTSSFSFDSSKAQRVYFVGDEITVTVDGSGVSNSTSTARMTSSSNIIAVVFQDTTGSTAYTSFTLTEDDTGPVCQFDSPAATSGTYRSTGPFTVNFSATDSGCGVSKISYTTNGDTPDFSGTGTVVSGSTGSASVGSSAAGDYELKIAAMDSLGNIGSASTFSYTIVPETVPPGKISSLHVTAITSTSFEVSWTAPSDTDYYGCRMTCTSAGYSASGTKTGTSFSMSGMSAGSEYTLTLYAIDNYGNEAEGVTIVIPMPNENQTVVLVTADGSGSTYKLSVLGVGETQNYGYSDYFLITEDIDLSGVSWDPIANYNAEAFTGTFNGNGYTVSNLSLTSTDQYQGFFGQVGAAGKVINLHIKDASLKDVGRYSAILVAYNYGTIKLCSVAGTINLTSTSIGQCCGGFAVENGTGGTISECWSSVNINTACSYSNSGGFIYYNSGGTISDCYSTGNVTGYRQIGGFLYYSSYSGYTTNCYSSGNVSGTTGYSGMFAYYNNAYITGSFCLEGSYNAICSSSGISSITVLTDDGMNTEENFTNAGWDFDTIWTIDTTGTINNGYPYLINNPPHD